MGDKKQPFRFRLPWLTSAATTRPVAQTEAPSQPNTSIPIQRPPFRPVGVASLQTTPTQAQAPAQKTETQGTSRPVSASRGTIQTRGTSQNRSPSTGPTQARAVSLPPSPSRVVSQPQSTEQAVSKQQSLSPLASHPAGQTSPQPSSSSRRATQERSQPPTSNRPPSSASKQAQPFGVAVKPSQASAEVKEVAPITGATTETPSAPLKPKERSERKKVAEEHGKLAAKNTLATLSTDEQQIKAASSAYPKNGSTQNKAHQKHGSSTWEQVPLHKEIKEDISKFVHKLTTEQPKLATEEKSISVLTLAGENRGASFQAGSEPSKKDGLVHIHRGYKINPDDSPDATTDGEESSRGRKPTNSVTKENPASRTYVNNNTQSINNSIVFESSVNARNPGVRLELVHNLVESTKSSGAKAEHVEPRKAEFNSTPAEKLTYEPTVRRRCLRGLLAESSDSDPDNPEKPRRHGCRYSCGGKNKQLDIGIF